MDEEGQVVPAHLHDVFLGTRWRLRSLEMMLKRAHDGLFGDPLVEQAAKWLEVEEIAVDLRHSLSVLSFAMPHAVCPKCKGNAPAVCKPCRGTGWVNKVTWQAMQGSKA